MRVRVIEPFESARGIINTGQIIEISETLLEKLKGKVVELTDKGEFKPDPKTFPHYCQPSDSWCSSKLPASNYPTICIAVSCEHYKGASK